MNGLKSIRWKNVDKTRKTWQEKICQKVRKRWNCQRQAMLQMTEFNLLVILLFRIVEIFVSEALYLFIFDLEC